MDSVLKKKTIIGTFWSAIDRFSVQGINFILELNYRPVTGAVRLWNHCYDFIISNFVKHICRQWFCKCVNKEERQNGDRQLHGILL